MKNKKLNEDEMFDLFEEKAFSKVKSFIDKYGIDSVDRDGRNLLLNFIIEHKTSFAEKLINTIPGLDINQQDKHKWTALHFAVQEQNLKIVNLLLEKGASVDVVDENGNTSLMEALFQEVKEEIIISLLEHGADINKKNKHKVSPKEFLEKSMKKVNQWLAKNKK